MQTIADCFVMRPRRAASEFLAVEEFLVRIWHQVARRLRKNRPVCELLEQVARSVVNGQRGRKLGVAPATAAKADGWHRRPRRTLPEGTASFADTYAR